MLKREIKEAFKKEVKEAFKKEVNVAVVLNGGGTPSESGAHLAKLIRSVRGIVDSVTVIYEKAAEKAQTTHPCLWRLSHGARPYLKKLMSHLLTLLASEIDAEIDSLMESAEQMIDQFIDDLIGDILPPEYHPEDDQKGSRPSSPRFARSISLVGDVSPRLLRPFSSISLAGDVSPRLLRPFSSISLAGDVSPRLCVPFSSSKLSAKDSQLAGTTGSQEQSTQQASDELQASSTRVKHVYAMSTKKLLSKGKHLMRCIPVASRPVIVSAKPLDESTNAALV